MSTKMIDTIQTIKGNKMNQSESIGKLAFALCAAQAEMGGAVKDSNNPFFQSKYADLTSVVKAIKEPFSGQGLSYIQFPLSRDGEIGVTTRLMHVSGEWLESEFTLPMTKKDPQAAGSAITYARRYALQSIAGIPTADDDAASASLKLVDEDITDISADIAAAVDIEALQAVFKMAWHSFPGSRPALTAVKDSRKKELENV